MSTNKDHNSVKFIATRFNVPLFMVSRNNLKYQKCKELESYMAKHVNLYANDSDREFETATLNHFEHILGLEKSVTTVKATSRPEIKTKTYSDKEKSWQLAPNRYDTLKTPFINLRGLGGAHWPKAHTHQARPRPNMRQPQFRFYDLPRSTEKMSSSCKKASGIFLTNARDRRATTRCMVSHAGTCYRDPNDPGPTTYNLSSKYNAICKSIKPNPHLFYRYSTVPVKKNSVHPSHASFMAAPGRYDIRYGRSCHCPARLTYKPEIDLLIEKEKRNKFRRLPYEKIKRKLYACPDWRHVKGRGFRHLFKGAKRVRKITVSAEQEGKKQKNVKLYPDSKYIAMITKPTRTPLSIRKEPLVDLPPRIKYNCIAKVIMRKQLRNNKKIAFNSGQERWPDGYRLPVLTQKQQELIKKSLPLDRQFRDHPIMEKRLSEIQPKIYTTPKHMLPYFVPKLRKKLFKFLPLPQAKTLVTEIDANIIDDDKNGYYFQFLDPKKFFKDNPPV